MLTRLLKLCGVVIVVLAGAVGWSGSALGQTASTCGGSFTGTGTVRSGGVERSYRVHVPAEAGGKPAPVVIGLHGRGSTAAAMERISGLSALDAIAVYPQALPGKDGQAAWQGAPYSSAVDDIGFINDLLDQLNHRFCVDNTRVYSVGLSNGGGLAAMLGCHLSGRIAGYATVAGAFYPNGGDCDPSRPMPVVNVHGTADPIVRYEGNPAKGQPPVQDWLRERADHHRCHGKEERRQQAGVEVQRWTPCLLAASVTHYRVVGGGHEWPRRLDTAELIWSELTRARLAV